VAKIAKTQRKTPNFNALTFLSSIGRGRRMVSFRKKETIFAQGDPMDGLFFIQTGKIRLSIVSDDGREAVLGILGVGDFFGEGGLAGQLLRMSSATALTDCILLNVEKTALLREMTLQPKLSALFMKYLLKRNIRYQDDLIDQLFNSSEKRLARVLLLMAHFGTDGVSEMSIPRLSQETLAEMVGTTRSRVSFFMNRFRKLGFIKYHRGENLRVHSSLLKVVLSDNDGPIADPDVPESTGRSRRKAPEAPARPGGPPDADRAQRPPIGTPKRTANAV
jgi:CRP/FNR family transcriptional regulator, cyclic AMP receptor protein